MVIISIVYIGWMAFNAGTHLILATLVGLNILMWVIYFTVFVWEVRHHKAVIAKKCLCTRLIWNKDAGCIFIRKKTH